MNKGLDGRGIYRAIYVSIWDDPDFRKLSSDEKLVLLNLRTSPLTNMPVIYPYYLEAIQRQTGLGKNTVLRAIDTLCDTHWIAIQEGIVWVKKGLKFDPNITLTNEKHLAAIKNIILGLPKIQIVRDFIDFYKIKIPYPIPPAIPSIIPHAIQEPNPEPKPDKEPEKEKEKDCKEEEKPKISSLLSSIGKEQTPSKKLDPASRKAILEEQKKILGVA